MPNISKKEIRQAVHVLKACLHHPDADDAIAMLQGLLDQPEGEPVAYMNSDDLCADTAFRWVKLEVFTEPLYTHPTPFTPITAADVTPKMMVECNNNLASDISTAEFVAAVNAYMGAKK
jgi:hypothetical protein